MASRVVRRIFWLAVLAVVLAAAAVVLGALGLARASVQAPGLRIVQVRTGGYLLGPSFGVELGGPHASGWICSGGTEPGHPQVIDGISCSLVRGPGLG